MARTGYYDVLNGVTSVPAGLLQALEERSAYVIKDGETPSSLTPGNVLYLVYQNVMFWYDTADSTTTGDNVTCIVTSDGKRFKNSGFSGKASRITPVINRTRTAPPTSPSNGDTYLVATGATGTWAGKDKMIASYTARGWVFLAPNTYDIVYSVADAGYYFYNASAVWTSGLPALTIGDNTVSPSKFKYGKFGLGVVNQTTNTPPTTPSDGDAYIIGTSPTGAWSGNARKIAIYETSAWVIYTPVDGWTVYDKTQFSTFVYYGGVWNTTASGIAAEKIVKTANTYTGNPLTISTTAVAGYRTKTSTNFASAPTTSQPYFDFGLSFTHQCAAGKTIEFTVKSFFQLTTGSTGSYGGGTFGVFVDSAATAADWSGTGTYSTGSSTTDRFSVYEILSITTADSSSHTYKLLFFPDNGGASGSTAFYTTFYLQNARAVMRQLA